MKTHFLNFAAAALIVLAAASCNKEEIINTGGDGTKAIALSISIGEPGTKAFDAPYKEGIGDFERLDIYFTNTGGKILYHWAASADATDSDGQTLWDNFVNNSANGVKFLGLSGDVTGVYVVANVPTLQAAGENIENGKIESDVNINDLNGLMKLVSYGPTEEQDAMPYAGGDITLVPTSSASENAGEIYIDGSEESGNYVKADIHLRPAISRVEIERVGVKTRGINYYEYADGNLKQITSIPGSIEAGKEYYSVAWRNFNVDFVGVYMSDVYRRTNLFPASSNIAQWNDTPDNFFSTPVFEDGNAPISEGKWLALSTEQELNEILAFSGYNSGYTDLVTDLNYSHDEDPNTWLFYGAGGEGSSNPDIIPFHFFVPYDVTEEKEITTKVGIADDVDPKLHFQFTKGENYNDQEDGFKIDKILKYTNAEPNGVEVSAGNVFEQLEVMYNWPSTLGDGTAYANVIKFSGTENGTDYVQIDPGYIYRLKSVLIDPTNLNPAPSNNDVNDVYVVVTVIPFAVENVYPVFE